MAETAPADKQLNLLIQHPVWKEALNRNPDFRQIKETCEQQKQSALDQIGEMDDNEEDYALSPANQNFQEFQRNDAIIWNPYYVLTNRILSTSA